jgi:hypothetical protein
MLPEELERLLELRGEMKSRALEHRCDAATEVDFNQDFCPWCAYVTELIELDPLTMIAELRKQLESVMLELQQVISERR